jgi:signal transduction histidine kinase
MDSRAGIVASTWIAIAIISSMYIYVGRITIETDIIVALLVAVAFMITFAIGFGIEAMRRRMEYDSPTTKVKIQMANEMTELKTAVNELSKKVDAIQKELEA